MQRFLDWSHFRLLTLKSLTTSWKNKNLQNEIVSFVVSSTKNRNEDSDFHS